MSLPTPEALLPHRPPQLYLDRLVEWDGRRLVAEGQLDAAALDPVAPLALVEGLAQAMGCLGRLNGQTGDAVLLGLESVAFPGPPTKPGRVRFEVTLLSHQPRISEARGVATSGDDGAERILCTATLRAALL